MPTYVHVDIINVNISKESRRESVLGEERALAIINEEYL